MATLKGNSKPMFIGIAELYYGDVFDAAVTTATLAKWLKAQTTKKILNSHNDTFGYEQEDGETREYINELTGEVYFTEPVSQGKRTMSFTMGEFDFEDKASLQGGEVVKEGTSGSEEVVGWSSPESLQLINKGLVGKTKTGNYVVFTNGNVIGKTNMADKNMGLGVTATALSNPYEGVKAEYWFKGAKVDAELKKAQ